MALGALIGRLPTSCCEMACRGGNPVTRIGGQLVSEPSPHPPIRLFLGGAAKSGTTALLQYLAAHPEIRSHVHREMTYFARDEEYERGYAAAFERYFSGSAAAGTVHVAKHAMALYSQQALERAAAHSESTELVIMLRNPVDRAYSHYWYARLRGWERADSFEAALRRAEGRATPAKRQGNQLNYVEDGVYEPHLRRAIDVFGTDRTHVLLSSDLQSNATDITRRLFEQVGVEPDFALDTSTSHNRAARARSERMAQAFLRLQSSGHPVRRAVSRVVPNPWLYRVRYAFHRLNEKYADIPEMDPDTRSNLLERFSAHNEALAALIGRDLEAWTR